MKTCKICAYQWEGIIENCLACYNRIARVDHLRAENAKLLADRDGLALLRGADNVAGKKAEERARKAEAENVKLRAALEQVAAPKRPDGTYNRCREACEQIAYYALHAGEVNSDEIR